MKLRIIHDTFVRGEHLKKNEIIDLDPEDANDNETMGHLNAAGRIVEVGSKSEEIWQKEQDFKAGKKPEKPKAAAPKPE